MDSEKPKFNWQRMLITVGIILVATLVVGGTTWYIMDKSAKEVKTANEKSVAELQKQVDELKASTRQADTNTTAENATTTDGKKTYTHSSPAFSLEYPGTQTITGNTPADPAVWLSTDGSRSNTTLQITYEATKNISPGDYFESLVKANAIPEPYTIVGPGPIGANNYYAVEFNHQGTKSTVLYTYSNGYTYTISYPTAQTETYVEILKTLKLS